MSKEHKSNYNNFHQKGSSWTLEKIQKLAISRNGKLISETYKKQHEHLIWECNVCFKQWSATLANITKKNRPSWCPNCNRHEWTIDEAHEIAKSKNGKCLTSRADFENGGQKLKFECHLGHIWEADLYHIGCKNSWCHRCSGSVVHSYVDVKFEIELRGWTLLSKEYKNANQKLQIKCKNDHVFKESLGNIKYHGYGCKYCNTRNMCENICRAYFETIFDKEFLTVHPKYMERLELDGYCAELGIAFEHHGPQHYSLKAMQGIWAKYTEVDFQELLERDIKKIKLCEKYGIKLIVIPYLFEMTKLNNLLNFINEQCKLLNIITKNINELKVDLSWAYNRKMPNSKMKQFEELNG